MDFFQICTREIESGPNKGTFEIFPDFVVGRSTDLMVRGKHFYAVWDETAGIWSTDEYDVQRLVDEKLREHADEIKRKTDGAEYRVKYLRSFANNGWRQFRNYLSNVSDNSHDLDNNLTFANSEVKKSDYVSRRLPYSLEPGSIEAWDELVGTLYAVDEREKIEYFIGALMAGDAKKIDKFVVLYGPPGAGKGTIITILQKLTPGYHTTFDAKALGSNGDSFATEAFKDNPLVALQHDGDLSRIEDNARLNSIVSHEDMRMNEKYKPGYTSRVNAFLWMGTNKPVKISDAKSGIIRRLIDVHPTGVKIPKNHYLTLMSRIDFELGAIAHHCLQVYRALGKNHYEGYRPLEMMFQTDIFFNFIEYNYDVFKKQDGTTLRQAYMLYKEFCKDTGIDKPLPQYKIREELKNYFDDFKDRAEVDGTHARSVYIGFSANKFKEPAKNDIAFSLVIEESESLLDKLLATQPAQYANEEGFPTKKWENVTTTLSQINTEALHFVKVPENMFVVDFDLTDENGEKSLEANLAAASVWPATYAELSKSGAGIHLHYFTDLDKSTFAAHFSDGIEIKSLVGNASLRRLLTRCNGVPIATLNNGIPLKEKRMLESKTMSSERTLRRMIGENFQKKYHSSTKPSIDFIKKILDDAYESGMPYDVSDLRTQVMAFANNSSHQPLEALAVVGKMKFKSAESSEDLVAQNPEGWSEAPEEEKKLVLFDLEVYPNLLVICWKYQGVDDMVTMINPSPQEVEQLIRTLLLVGYNVRRYDNHILYARAMGYDNKALFELSQKIIENDRNATFGEAYGISHADIYDFASIKKSLKLWQVELGLPHKEMNIPWDEPVSDEMIPIIVEYCSNDVRSEEAVLDHLEQDFVARKILAAISGLAINDTTARHTSRIIFGNDRRPQDSFIYTDLRKEFPGYEFDAGKSTYRGEDPSEGGYIFRRTGIHKNVAVYDIASMHPTSITQLNLFGQYTPNFTALTAARLAIKHGDFETASKMFNGKLAPFLSDPKKAKQLSYALKIVINTVYGLTSAKFDNPFRDPNNIDNIVAKRGALFMIDLKNACLDRGMDVVHIKTDSIKIADATDQDWEFVRNFGDKYGYTFEHEATYSKMALVNDAVFIAQYSWHAEEPELVGTWSAVGAQFQHPYVFKTLFSKEPIEFKDLCEIKQVFNGAAIYLDFEHDRPAVLVDGMHFVGRVGAFVPVTQDAGGAMMYRVKDGKLGAVSGTKGYLWVEAEMAETMKEDCLDMGYFMRLVDDAIATINKFGSFEEFVNG